jgi:CMP-N,N'-diacetyllegionaminic acid synthase
MGGVVLGVIPARGGSKGVHLKNLRMLGGMPLVAWSCIASKRATTLHDVVCDTDCQHIADVAKEAGVRSLGLRPQELASDQARVVDTLRHTVALYEDRGPVVSHVVLIQPTSPFVLPSDIDRAVRLAQERGSHTVISGFACEQKHPSTMFGIGDGQRVQWYLPDKDRMRQRQELNGLFFRSGVVYVVRRDILDQGTIYGDLIHAIEVQEERAMSIDSMLDLRLAELMAEADKSRALKRG